MTAPLLALHAITRRFAGLTALEDVALAVMPGTIHALIGPNGAGKTTLFNLITGLLPPSGGSIHFQGRPITRLPAHRRTALGLARTFQNIRLFPSLPVLENVLTGLHPRLSAGLLPTLLRLPRFRAEERAAVARARAVLDLTGLAAAAERPAGSLSYGDQRRLEIARALAPAPALLLLDEPAAGMNPAETAALATLLRRLPGMGTTLLLVEHDMGFVMGLSDHVTVLNFGRRIFDGRPEAARRDRGVIAAYLGQKVADRLAGAALP
jgi:branched-chain amino acid transport system ATP-binding protein